MVIIEAFSWWYSHGWHIFISKCHTWLASITDFFSMSSLIRTLFKPFRQISAEAAAANSSLDLKFRMFLDRLISRIVGFFSRLILLLVGVIAIIIGGVFSLLLIILWPLIPLTPIAGIVLAAIGVIL